MSGLTGEELDQLADAAFWTDDHTIGGVAVAGGHLQPSTTDVQPVLWFSDTSDTGGQSVLTRTDGMGTATVEAAGLTPGYAYTLWSGCTPACADIQFAVHQP